MIKTLISFRLEVAIDEYYATVRPSYSLHKKLTNLKIMFYSIRR